MKTLTVGELIERLKKVNPNLPVIGEGCDCDNPVVDVEEESDRAYLRVEL